MRAFAYRAPYCDELTDVTDAIIPVGVGDATTVLVRHGQAS
jgi:hypothetical protein